MRYLLAGTLLALAAGLTWAGFGWSPRKPPTPEPQPTHPTTPAPQPPKVLFDLPDFKLTDQRGRPFGRDALAGQVWVVDFIFTRCSGICPRMTRRMGELQRQLPGLRLLSISTDPKYDTPQVLTRYARLHEATARWHFLTGSWTDIEQLARNGFKVATSRDEQGVITHGDQLILVDRAGRIRGYYHSNDDAAIERLTAQARLLLAR